MASRSLGCLPTALDEIDEQFLKKNYLKRGLSLAGRFERELRGLLQKPFYFHLIATGAVQLPANRTLMICTIPSC